MYEQKKDYQYAMLYAKKAVDAAKEGHLDYECAVFLLHWAELLLKEGLYDSVIEKAIEAQDIFLNENKISHYVCACELLGVAYYQQDNVTLSRKAYSDAFNAMKETRGKLYFSQKIAQLSAQLGDERTLNEQLAYIRKFETFDDERSIAAFEDWIKSLQRLCCNALPDDFKEQPNTYFLYDEEDGDFIRIRDDILKIRSSSNSVTERDEAIKNYMLQSAKEVSKQKKDNLNLEEKIKILYVNMTESKSLKEKAQLMYEIGCLYYRQRNSNEADTWLLKAMNADEASEHTIIWAKITYAQVLMNSGTIEDDERAKIFLDEVICAIETSKKYEEIAFCQFNRGRLEARKGNFQSALKLFEQSYKAVISGKINNLALCDEIKDCCSSVNQYLHFEDNPTEDIHSLQSELLFLQTWYPEYSQQLTEYWWYYRGKETLRNVRISGTSACVIFSDDKNEICWYSEALRSLFAHCLFAPKESWENIEHAVKRTIPAPCNAPFPYSVLMVYDKKIGGKVYGYDFQVDGSKHKYAYKRLQDDESFDKSRDPKPITLSFMGYRYPEVVSEIMPMTDELGSCRWWIGAEFGGSPDALLNLVSRFGVIPMFHFDDINTSDEIIVLRNERIDVPFITDEKNWEERKRIQKELRRMTSMSNQETMFSAFDNVIDHIRELPQEELPLVSVHLSIVRYKHYVWNESPVQWHIYPVILINAEDNWRNTEIDDAISRSVAIRDAIYLMQRISYYVQQTHNLDEYYIKKDALKVLELSKYIGDKDMDKFANTVLSALNRENEK